ncbi:UDP-glucose 4-epimerase GalE [Verticiella sediminum]|uniref:UDP-glucose 4-epimerase n=1 Tax=Verticiella sediminum TaxID=1247510 RepID=A0A556B0J6_9BURK|nr:UDP-glucose 4-epimerase GalE [Verticiella sediminum]TSH98683.1 UDP-glucose 4-epimerase GalE [Verticiella sediminum]
MTTLVTGGAGYIGTHSLVELHERGMPFVVIDNYSNSGAGSIAAVEKIIGTPVRILFGDIREKSFLQGVFDRLREEGRPITSVLHLAALKAVGESVREPLQYYENNVYGTLNLLDVMRKNDADHFVFSSSATVYGNPQYLPYDENHPIAPTNPYGNTKAMVEKVLTDVALANPKFRVVILRYFNPIGAHASGLIGEDPVGEPNNLFPYITRVAVRKLPELQVFGNDYATTDGTGVRDYLHVMDLAAAHALALELCASENIGVSVFNLGTGVGTSVLELVKAFENVSAQTVPLRIGPRRPGDVASMWADAALARARLGWSAKFGIEEMCRDGWRWQCTHPEGFGQR